MAAQGNQVWRRVVLHSIVLLACFVAFAAPSGSASAAAPNDELTIFGTLDYEDPESGEDVPVEGVEITVEGIGSATTDGDGAFEIVVPEPAEYSVSLDIETLPEGVELRQPDRNPLETEVNDRDRRVLFALVSGDAVIVDDDGGVSFRQVAQLTVEGLKTGLYLAMAAIGLSLIFGTTGLVNFAHAELVTWGMLSTYFFNFYGLAGAIGFLAPLPGPFGDGVDLIFAVMLGAVAGGLLGFLLNHFIFRNARRNGVGLIAQMVMTIGLSILLRYLFLYYFQGRPRPFADYSAQSALDIGPIDLTQKDLAAMTLSIVILVGVGAYLQMTRMGKAMRAVSDNRDLAESSGIDVEKVIRWVWVSGAALAALGGAFFGLDTVKWDFGFRTLLLIFAAVVLGGLGRAFGALVGALAVGLAINLSTLVIDAELKNMVALVLMVVILMIRPQGILGRAERIG